MFPLRWFFTLFGFPLGGFAASQIIGPADDVVSALVTGLLAGAIIGCAQWLAGRNRGFGVRGAIVTSAGMAIGAVVANVLTAVALAPVAVVLAGSLEDANPSMVSVAMTVGVLASAVQFLGLVRWPIAATLTPFAYVAWSAWLVVVGVVLIA